MDSSPEAPLVSLCTTVMNRLHHLRRTLLANIAANHGFDRLEYVILDYSSSDGLADWVRTDLAAHVASGLVRFAQLQDRAHFQMAHAKNLSHRLARGGIVCNMDADNFSGCGFADYLMREFSSRSSIFVKGKGHGLGGRLAFRRDEFLALGGYDEAMAEQRRRARAAWSGSRSRAKARVPSAFRHRSSACCSPRLRSASPSIRADSRTGWCSV